MPALFVVGNPNQFTFANAILAAHVIDQDRNGRGLTDVFVLHSVESERVLASQLEWRVHLQSHGVDPEIIAPFTVDLKRGKEALGRAARHIERCVASCDRREDIYVDLTNGSSLYKNVLSNIAYVLGARHQFILDLAILAETQANTATPRAPSRQGFLSLDELRRIYLELPDPSLLDSLAPSWLTEVRRFNVRARDMAEVLTQICGKQFSAFTNFEGNIGNAVDEWFKGERYNDGSALGGSVRYVGSAFEEMVGAIYEKLKKTERNNSGLPLHQKLLRIGAELQVIAADYEPHLLVDIANLLRQLRNASTHESTSADFGRIRARLSTELLFAAAEYFKVLHSHALLDGSPLTSATPGAMAKYTVQGTPGREYYFGLDGDDTGRQLEELFQAGATDAQFSRFAEAIVKAMKKVEETVTKAPLKGKVLFCTGDDILFKAIYEATEVENLRRLYSNVSGGLTCSIGFGLSVREAYVALKMAKASPGKNTTVGIELV